MGTICNSQDRETTYMSINRGMDKEDVVHIYNVCIVLEGLGLGLGESVQVLDIIVGSRSQINHIHM